MNVCFIHSIDEYICVPFNHLTIGKPTLPSYSVTSKGSTNNPEKNSFIPKGAAFTGLFAMHHRFFIVEYFLFEKAFEKQVGYVLKEEQRCASLQHMNASPFYFSTEV